MQKTILIVEDDANIADLVRIYLEKDGFAVQIAGDGGAGLRMFRDQSPDLVLLDIMLPIMDGWQVLSAIREQGKTPVIMLTAKEETDDNVHFLEQGADDYITKPFEVKELLARVHAVLRRFGGEDERKGQILSFDKLEINMESYELIVDGKKVDTPP